MEKDQKQADAPVMLPVVFYKGKRYFADARLRQLRTIRNPHDYIDFTDVEWGCLIMLLNYKMHKTE